MKKLTTIAPVLIWCLIMIGCESIEQQARDTAAALGGAITSAQAQNQASCTAATTPKAAVCGLINDAVAAQNALITADEAYCGFAPGTPLTQTCQPVKSAEGALTSAISNATPFINQLKGILR